MREDLEGWGRADTALGPVVLTWSATGLRTLDLGEVVAPEGLPRRDDHPWVREAARALGVTHTPASLPLDPVGTPFQRRVWDALRAIPSGQTRTYAAIAASLDPPSVARAVGAACGANRLAVFVPCHRAVAADGGLAGFRWGLERKRALLAREDRQGRLFG